MMPHIPAGTATPTSCTEPVTNSLRQVNDIFHKVVIAKSIVALPVSFAVSWVASLSARKMADVLPAVADTLNRWAGNPLITPRQVETWQAYLKNPNQPLDAVLKNYLEPCFSLLARYVLEQPTMLLLGGKPGEKRQVLDMAKANKILDRESNRERLKQLFMSGKTGESTLENEIQRSLLIMINLVGCGGREVIPWEINNAVLEELLNVLRDSEAWQGKKNSSDTAQRQHWTPAEMKEVKDFLIARYAAQFSSQFVSSEMLVQLSGVPARLQSGLLSMVWPTGTEPPAAQEENLPLPVPAEGIHIPFAGMLRTLSPAGQQVVLAPNASMVVNMAACPAQLSLNTTSTPPRGISLGGVGRHSGEDMELFLSNNNAEPVQVYLKSGHRATRYTSTLVTPPLRRITHQSADEPATALTDEVCPLRQVARPATLVWPTLSQPLPVQPAGQADLWQSFLTLPGVDSTQHNPYVRVARDVTNERQPGVTPHTPNPVQYDRLPDVVPVPGTAAPTPAQNRAAFQACKLWQQVITHAPLAEIEAGCVRYLALRHEHVALREIGKDYRFQEETLPTPTTSLKTLRETIENLLTRPDDDTPFSLNMEEFPFFLNNQRTRWELGLAILSGGEERASLRMFGKMILPLLERTLKDITPTPLFAGFASLSSKIISGLTEASIATITVDAFASRVADKTRQFCDELAQQYPQLSSLDIARIRLLLDEQNKEAFPGIEFALHPEIKQMPVFSETGIWAALAAKVVDQDKYSSIPLKTVKRIGLHILLNQTTGTLVNMLGWTTRVSTQVKKRLIDWWQQESQGFTDIWEFVRARRVLDKLLLEPQGVTPARLHKAKTEEHAALRQFYKNAFLSLPQYAVEWLTQNYPNPLTATFVQIYSPYDSSPGKPCLGVILQYDGKAHLITPIARIGDPSRRVVFDVTEIMEGAGFRTPQQKQKLSDILFENPEALPRHKLKLTTMHLFFRSASGMLWNENLAETVVAKMEKIANFQADASPHTSTVAPKQSVVDFLYTHAKTLLYFTPGGSCLEVLDNIIDPGQETFWGKLGMAAICVAELIPGEEEVKDVVKFGESIAKQGLKWVKNHQAARRIAAQAQNPNGEEAQAFIKWEEEQLDGFNVFYANVEDLYAHRELQRWLAPLPSPSAAPLSTATFRPEMTSEETLNELAGYASYGSEEEGKEYLRHQFGDNEVLFEVITTSLSPDGELLYEIPAGAPTDRIVTVKKDKQGHLQVVGNHQIKILPYSMNATNTGDCGLEVPDGMTVEETYLSIFNDNRLVIKVKDRDGKIYWREVDARGQFIPLDPGIFANILARSERGIDDDPVSNDTPLYTGRYGLAKINDKKRQAELLALYQARNQLMQLKPEQQQMVEIIWEADRVKKLPGHLALKNYVDSLAESDMTFPGYQALLSVIDKIASGALTFITEKIPATKTEYRVRLQELTDAEQGLKNIIKIFELPNSDHSLTQADIEKYQTLTKALINAADMLPTKIFAVRKADDGYTNQIRRYIDLFGKYLFKSAKIGNLFRFYFNDPGQPKTIKYVAAGEMVADKFPYLKSELEKIHNENMLTIEKWERTVQQSGDFIPRTLKDFMNIPQNITLNTQVFENIIKGYHDLIKKTNSGNVRVFKDISTFNGKSQQYEHVNSRTVMERKILNFSAIEGHFRSGDPQLRVGINCNIEGNIARVATTMEHEYLHPTILKYLPQGRVIKGEAYLTYTNRPTTLLRTEQVDLLEKLMSAPAVLCAYMEEQNEFVEAFIQACIFSSQDEIANLAKEIHASWLFPLTAANQVKLNRILHIMYYEHPEFKNEPFYHFPDFIIAMYRHLVKKIPAEITAAVETEWEARR